MFRLFLLVSTIQKKDQIISNDNKPGTVELLFTTAQQMNLEPQWITNKYLFSVTTPHGERYINGSMSTLNSQVDSALVRNKFHTRLILERFKLPNIPYERLTTLEQAERFLQKHKTIIVKPTNGYGAQDINIVTDVRQIAVLNLKEYIFEKYVTGKEMRYLILNGKVIAVHQSEYGTSVAADRDLERLSFAQSEWDEELTNLALRVAQIFRLKFAAVDFLIDKGGKPYVLEVNTSPGLKWFHSPSSGPSVDVATMFLEAMLKD